MDIGKTIDMLQVKGISFENGLSGQEVNSIESLYYIKFPPDLKEFLCIALPVSNNFVNWRDMSKENIRSIKDRLLWPLEGMIFDIENNEFWYSGWGIEPDDLKEAIKVCKNQITKAPKLVPIYSHRYIPSEPQEVGNPVFQYTKPILYIMATI